MPMRLPAPYPELLEISRRMLDAAKANNWDALSALGEEQQRLAANLPARTPLLPPGAAQELAQTIRAILDANAEISEQAKPWLEHPGQLLKALGAATAFPSQNGG